MTIETLKQLFKFSWAQAWSDQNGKSSASAWTGWYLAVVGGLGFLYSLPQKDVNGMMYSVAMATLGAGLLGYNKKINGKPEAMGVVEPGTVQQTVTENPPVTTTQTTITPPEQ